MFVSTRSQLYQRLGLALVGLGLVAYLGWLLGDLYASRADLERYQRAERLRESRGRATALQYFFAERLSDGEVLAALPEAQAFLSNEALGMSMAYGLAASIGEIAVALEAFRRRVQLGDAPLYERMVYADPQGRILADVPSRGGSGALRPEALERALQGPAGGPHITVAPPDLVLVVPVRFRERPGGHVVAWLSSERLYRQFVAEDAAELSATALVWDQRLLYAPPLHGHIGPEAMARGLALGGDEERVVRVRSREGQPEELTVARRPIAGASLALVTAIASPAPRTSPVVLVAVTSSLGVLLVVAGLASYLRFRRDLEDLTKLFLGLPFALLVLDAERRIVSANAAAERLLATARGELSHRLVVEFLPEASPHGSPEARELLARDARGRSRSVLVAEVPTNLGGQPLVIVAFIDLSEQKMLETRLRHASKLEAVGQLAAGIAHEINTPLQFISDHVTLLRDALKASQDVLAAQRTALMALEAAPGASTEVARVAAEEERSDLVYLLEEAPRAVGAVEAGLTRVSSIVRAMKEFGHVEQRDFAMADINRALENTLAIARSEYKDVADVETQFGALPLVLCSISDCNQVFLHLLVNAAHAVGASGRRGRITVRTRHEGDAVVIEVADTGCGIPAAIRDRVFEPFFTTKPVGRGSGQGLALARSIVMGQHGGSLTFESVEAQGTTFVIRLPVEGPAREVPREVRAA